MLFKLRSYLNLNVRKTPILLRLNCIQVHFIALFCDLFGLQFLIAVECLENMYSLIYIILANRRRTKRIRRTD